jgi:hypothetical protein
MGFFKKIIRKVTKPISKVLDKVVPNEIKPFLPYAAAFAPMLAPGMFASGAGGLGSLFKLGKFGGGALLGGGLSSLAQLAQEGNEGDINLLSAGLGALSGGMSQAPAGMFTDMKTPTGSYKSAADAVVRPEVSILDKVKNVGLDTLEKGSGILKAGAADPFSMEGLKAATIPFSLATGDAMAAESNLAMKEYERALAEYNEQQGAMGTDTGRREAILAAMRAYNHPEELIESTLAELGLRNGGRVGLEFGGIPAAVQKVADKQLTSNLETAQDMQMPIEDLVQEFIELKKRKPNNYDELMDFYRQKYGTGSKISSMTEEMTEEFAANGGIMGRQGYISGGAIKGGLKAIMGMGDEVVDLSKQKEVFRDGPITADFLQTVDKSIIDPAIRSRDTMGPGGYGMYNNLAEMPAGLQAAELISRIRKPGGGIDYEKAEMFIGKKLKGNETIDELIAMIVKPQRVQKAADGGIMEYNMGGSVLPDGIEMDYRGGGFIPMGSKERADDVPARVSKNEFVMTADAVRAAGGGSVNKGAKRMYELMNKLEARA